MKNLNDEELVKAYLDSIELKLEPNFIRILESELELRSIHIKEYLNSSDKECNKNADCY